MSTIEVGRLRTLVVIQRRAVAADLVCWAVHADRPVWLSFAQEGFPVYEIVGRFRQREGVIETVNSLEIAWTRVQAYKRQRLMAYFRPTVLRAPSFPPYVVNRHNTRDEAVLHAVER